MQIPYFILTSESDFLGNMLCSILTKQSSCWSTGHRWQKTMGAMAISNTSSSRESVFQNTTGQGLLKEKQRWRTRKCYSSQPSSPFNGLQNTVVSFPSWCGVVVSWSCTIVLWQLFSRLHFSPFPLISQKFYSMFGQSGQWPDCVLREQTTLFHHH